MFNIPDISLSIKTKKEIINIELMKSSDAVTS